MWKRSVLVPVVILALALGLFLFIRFGWPSLSARSGEQETDDAYVRADQTPLSTRVSGTVKRVNVGDYQLVRAGQLLVEIEDSDYQAVVSETKSALAAANAEYQANQNAKRVADATVSAAREGIAAADATRVGAQAGIDASNADVRHAESEFQRQKRLFVDKAATKQQFEAVQASRDQALAALNARQADLVRATASVASSQAALEGAGQQRAALNAKDSVLRAQIAAKEAAITVAQVNLGYTKIYAPAGGSVGEFRVHAGQLVGAGTQIVELVQSGVWIQANYRETQLGGVRLGDRADVRIDALPATMLHGHVAEVSPASGSQFALLPPDNATGNFTKVVQRIPVRIALDSSEAISRLKPGFSAVVTIHASDGAVPARPAFGTRVVK
ncbi:HlyD family secretion protein [Terriglobus sp. ADX1]|uniref:HlyD family secretion protein n=1 Tax=Terriglobus sp. ADX1 TaxID=2794063 RepID=UPI002FE57B08